MSQPLSPQPSTSQEPETPRKRFLRQKINEKEKLLARKRRKIRSLQQRNRRYSKKVTSLKLITSELKKNLI